MTAPSPEPRPRIQIVEQDTSGPDHIALVVRCLAITRLGARFNCTDQQGRTLDLTLTEIERYPQVTVPYMDPPHAARLTLTGTNAHTLHLQAGDILHGTNPTP
ncbi:hypothetical protein ABZ916_37130 [Streptomyces sp. NPDC046853]|uniref:hypothetical protein n=1 Tax=Streptomyces sp. NPDC046853 TaxID=3154920 RepID=UPI0033D83F54